MTPKEKVYTYFEEQGIKFKAYDHPALFTCADNAKHDLSFDAECCKNLFLRNKNKSKYYLVSMSVNKKVSLNEIAEKLNEKKLCFANEEELAQKLNIKSGACSVLNIIGVEKTDTIFVIDKVLTETKKVDFHPNDNTATIVFDGKDIEKVLKNFGAEYKISDL